MPRDPRPILLVSIFVVLGVLATPSVPPPGAALVPMSGPAPLPEPDPLPGDAGPRIALVFDDLGYSTTGLARELLELPVRLTFAVIPGLRHSAAFAESARAHGHEVILHLPIEPLDLRCHDPGENALFVDLAPEENRRRLRASLDGLPSYTGISNHMGSRGTADGGLMTLVMREIRDRDDALYFLDSRTTPFSVIPERARAEGVRCVRNDLFLDDPCEELSDPEERTDRLLRLARRDGAAVGIGHVRRTTVAAVREAVERWEEEGITLVTLSDLVQREPPGT